MTEILDADYRTGQIKLHDEAAFEGMRKAGRLAAEILDALAPMVQPGVTTGALDDVVRLGLYLTDLGDFAAVNAVMAEYFAAPFPARSTIEVSALPKAAGFEVDAVMVLD